MRLNKSTNQAVRILIECAQAGDELTKVADLSARLDITPQNTFKIVHILSRAGFVESMRGRYGGVRLAKPAADIRIGDVVREIEAGIEQERLGKADRDRGFESLIDEAFGAFLGVLDGQTLADMSMARRKTSKRKAKSASAKSRARVTAAKSRKTASKRAWSART